MKRPGSASDGVAALVPFKLAITENLNIKAWIQASSELTSCLFGSFGQCGHPLINQPRGLPIMTRIFRFNFVTVSFLKYFLALSQFQGVIWSWPFGDDQIFPTGAGASSNLSFYIRQGCHRSHTKENSMNVMYLKL